MNNIKDLINNIQNTSILLVGDIMLDSYIYGDVSRISPEGPIPILSAKRQNIMLGGAGNVFANLKALGAKVSIISRIGQDDTAHAIKAHIHAKGEGTDYLIEDETHPTTLKTRYISQNQQLLRVDQEIIAPLSAAQEKAALKNVENLLPTTHILILSDYGKGVLSPSFIQSLIKMAIANKVRVVVDPKGNDFSIYRGANFITPNRKELSEALGGAATKTNQEIEQAGQRIIKECNIETVIATRSEDGMSVLSKNAPPLHLKTNVQEVYDVSGAGDTVVAVLGATLAAGGDIKDAARLANIAGGLAVAKLGTAIISAAELSLVVQNETLPQGHIANIYKDESAARTQIEQWQAQGLRVGFTNGCFDILHYGHVNYLNQARQKCERLVLGLNHDSSVKILKGEGRPINDEMARATVMAALGAVDMVVFFGATQEGQDNTPCGILDILRPDIIMKGGDYTIDQLPEAQVVLAYGGEVDIMPLYEGYSTTNIIEKSKKSA